MAVLDETNGCQHADAVLACCSISRACTVRWPVRRREGIPCFPARQEKREVSIRNLIDEFYTDIDAVAAGELYVIFYARDSRGTILRNWKNGGKVLQRACVIPPQRPATLTVHLRTTTGRTRRAPPADSSMRYPPGGRNDAFTENMCSPMPAMLFPSNAATFSPFNE